ncbi:hypothetical protein AAG906_002049 [Vitis piasezkii]
MITYSRVLGNIRSLPNGEDSRIQYNPGFLDLYLMLVIVLFVALTPEVFWKYTWMWHSSVVKIIVFRAPTPSFQATSRNGVRELQRELWRIEAMMRDADARKDYDNRFNVWIQEVRTEAYAIEDVLDLFRLHWDQESVWRHLKMWHSISNLIQDINTRLAIISAETNTYLNVRVVPLIPGRGDNTVGIDEPKGSYVRGGNGWLGKDNACPQRVQGGEDVWNPLDLPCQMVGEEYLNELIGKSLIKAIEMDFDERPITVGVHSLMRRVNIGSNFKLLKVLDIQSTPLGNFPSAITDLVLLRYPKQSYNWRNFAICWFIATKGDRCIEEPTKAIICKGEWAAQNESEAQNDTRARQSYAVEEAGHCRTSRRTWGELVPLN